MAVEFDSGEQRPPRNINRTRFVIGKLKTSKTVSPRSTRRRQTNDHSDPREESDRNSSSRRLGLRNRREGKDADVKRSSNSYADAKKLKKPSAEVRWSDEKGEELRSVRVRFRRGDGDSESRKGTEEDRVSRRSSMAKQLDAEGDRPRRRKRAMRIDRHDISNKRIDEAAATCDRVAENEEEWEPSKNALFRAIVPSPSILSFVEDNLLGRRRRNEWKKAGYNIDLSAPLDNIPFSTNTVRERIEESVFRNKLEFFAAAKVSSSFPPPDLPEIAFAGRSNVGKSSLLNALTRQWGVVRTSDKPGHTQTINFFKLASKLCLVDLPGYGFAYAKEEVKDAWEELVQEYVSTRVGVERVCVLIDTKWGMKQRDYDLIDLMERFKTPYQVVLTKTDMVFPIDVARRAMQIQKELRARKSMVKPVMMVSSKSGAGIRSLRPVLAKLARFVKP